MGDIQKGLPKGVSFNVAYDRSSLIEASIENVKSKLIEEIAVVCIIVIIFLFHWRSALSIIIQIPITIASRYTGLSVYHQY